MGECKNPKMIQIAYSPSPLTRKSHIPLAGKDAGKFGEVNNFSNKGQWNLTKWRHENTEKSIVFSYRDVLEKNNANYI